MEKLTLKPIEDALVEISRALAAQIESAEGEVKEEYQCELDRLNAITVLLRSACRSHTVGG